MNTTPASTKTARTKRALPCSSYQAEFAEQARKLCLLLGADDQDLARFFDVPPAMLQEWLSSVPEFAAAVRAGRTLADADVADRLWRRAMGYSHDAVRIFSHQGKALEVAYTEHYPPDTAACLFWLKSRQPERWRESNEHDHQAPVEMLASLDAAGERVKNVRRS
ncbi:MAG: helix-turn-helix domain-containing protein [Rhodospirillales bacterium]|nr:helix-turn-helix domain-containing protein [Rhodospirillales bacterium]